MVDLLDEDYELLSAYLDRELTEPEQTALEARLQAEPQLQAALEELRVVKQAVAALPIVPAPRDFRLTPAVAAAARTPQPRVVPWWMAAAAALALVLVGIGVVVLTRPPDDQPPAMIAAAPTEIVSPTADEGADATVFEAALSAAEFAPTLPPSPEVGLTRQMSATPTALPPMPMLAAPPSATEEADEAVASMAFEAALVDAQEAGQSAAEAPGAGVLALLAPDVTLQGVLQELAALLWALVQLALRS